MKKIFSFIIPTLTLFASANIVSCANKQQCYEIDFKKTLWLYPIECYVPSSEEQDGVTEQEALDIYFRQCSQDKFTDALGEHRGVDIMTYEFVQREYDSYSTKIEQYKSYLLKINSISFGQNHTISISSSVDKDYRGVDAHSSSSYEIKNVEFAMRFRGNKWSLLPKAVDIYLTNFEQTQNISSSESEALDYLQQNHEWSFSYQDETKSSSFDYKNASKMFEPTLDEFYAFWWFGYFSHIYYFDPLLLK